VQKKHLKRIPGMKGPFVYPNGRVLYQDRNTKEYYDPRTDFFISDEEVNFLKQQIFDTVKG